MAWAGSSRLLAVSCGPQGDDLLLEIDVLDLDSQSPQGKLAGTRPFFQRPLTCCTWSVVRAPDSHLDCSRASHQDLQLTISYHQTGRYVMELRAKALLPTLLLGAGLSTA